VMAYRANRDRDQHRRGHRMEQVRRRWSLANPATPAAMSLWPNMIRY